MGDKRWGGGGGGGDAAGSGGTWSFLTKTIPSVSGFVNTVASKWLNDQDMLEEEERDTQLEGEIQGQIAKISELLREQERPLARDGTRNLDMEIQHQLNRIQELLVETKQRGGGKLEAQVAKQLRGMGGGGGSSVHSGNSFRGEASSQASRAGGQGNYYDDAPASPVRTPAGSDAGWSTAESASGYSGTGVQYVNTPQHVHPSRSAAPYTANARLGGGDVGCVTPGYPETPAVARTMRQPACVRDMSYNEGDDDIPVRQLANTFDTPAHSWSKRGGGDSRGSSRKGSLAQPQPQAVDQDELKTLFSRARHGRYKVHVCACHCVITC